MHVDCLFARRRSVAAQMARSSASWAFLAPIFCWGARLPQPYEFVSLQDMESATDVIVKLLELVATEA